MQDERPHARTKNGRKPGRLPGKVYCTAKADTCMNFPCNGRRTCRMHGGTAKIGTDSPSYRGGGHSRHMPKRLGERFDEAMLDPDFLSQRKRIAQMAARCDELWDRISAEERTANWPEAKRIWSEMWKADAAHTAAGEAGDAAEVDRQAEILSDRKAQFEALLSAGGWEQFAWSEFHKALDTTRRLIESERRREVESQQVIALSVVTLLVDRLADIVRRNVASKLELRNIAVEFTRELGQSSGIEAGL